MDKYEYIVNLAEKTAKRVSQNRESWMKFLTSAARIYKYPFKEQLLIYAQNPDATACASIEIWNKRMNCWVNKGSSGIALPDDTATYGHKLKYVFDVSNVHAVKPNGRYPKAWKLREEHKSDVLHRLEQIYGSTDSTKPFETLTNQLESAKIEVTKPFQQEEELAEKLKRLAELNALLNMDEKGTDALILEDDEQPAIVNSDMAVTPITSVKTKPMLKKKVVGLCL